MRLQRIAGRRSPELGALADVCVAPDDRVVTIAPTSTETVAQDGRPDDLGVRPIFTPSPRKMGPVSFADSLMSTSPAVQTPGMSSFPRSSPFTLPRRRSAFARAYSAMEPTSVQYPSAT